MLGAKKKKKKKRAIGLGKLRGEKNTQFKLALRGKKNTKFKLYMSIFSSTIKAKKIYVCWIEIWVTIAFFSALIT